MQPQEALHQCLGETHQGAGILMQMTGRSPFWEGGWVPPRQPSPSPTWPDGGWVPPGQSSPSPVPTWPDGGWAPQGPPPQPPTPAHPNPDVGHLINTLVSGLHLGTPRINTFSREATPGKTEVLFKQWNHEVQCVKDHYSELAVCESIVTSLKGAVADMAQYMGPTVSVSNILQKVTVIFRMVASFDVLMQNFCKVTQRNHEKVPSFTTRMEGTLN